MNDINAIRLFEELRLHPWKERDKVIIDAHLAMFAVTDPQRASELTAKYAKKLQDHLDAMPKAPEKVKVKDVSQPEAEIPEIEIAPKKRGRKPFSPSSK